MKIGTYSAAVLLLLVGAMLGWREFMKDSPAAPAVPAAASPSAAVPRGRGLDFPPDANPQRRGHKTSGRPAGPDSIARYLRADETERRRILEEWADRAGKGTSPDDVVERLADLHAKETDPLLKEEIVDALAWIGTGEAFDAILGILQEAPDPAQREIAAAALESVISDLAEAGEPQDWTRISRGLAKELPREVRMAAIDAMMTGGDRSLLPLLRPHASDGDAEVRAAAGEAIDWLEEP